MPAALELTSVFQHVNGHCALSDLTLSLDPGEWLLLVGANGAGKSLLTRLILGLDVPSAGRVHVFGEDLAETRVRDMQRLRARMGAVLQGGSLITDLTVLENLLLPLRATSQSQAEMARAARLIVTRLRLDGLENHLPRGLSLGQQRRVELARALIHRPDLLVWDGLTDGLDQPGSREIQALLLELRETEKLTFIATDNRPDLPLLVPDRVALLDRGRLLFLGSPEMLAGEAQRRLEIRYLLRGHP
jgi:ABC-type multidrug transport system ATPase subunit